MILVKETKLENEALRSKLDVLKSEYYKLESSARQGNADIKAELAVTRERLANYEMIEKELDQAIMHVAENDQIQGDGAYDVGNALIQTITNAPTTAKRRIQQSLLLANRLQQKQKEAEALQAEILALKDKVENQEADVKLHKRLLEKTNQPQAHMLADIERTEKELDFANRKIKQLDEQLKKVKHDNEQLRLSKNRLNDDLQRLLARRQDIENLQTTLIGVIQNSSTRKIDVDDLKSTLATQLRQSRFQADTSADVRREKEAVMKKLNRSRSRSKGGHGHSSNEQSFNKSNATVKMYADPNDSAVPAWYTTLKKNITGTR